MKKRKNIFYTALLISAVALTSQSVNAYKGPGISSSLIPDEGTVSSGSLGAKYWETINLDAQWVPLLSPKDSYSVFNGSPITPNKFGNIVEGGDPIYGEIDGVQQQVGTKGIYNEHGDKVTYTICPANQLSCTSQSQTNAGKYKLKVKTKDVNKALISDPLGKAVTEYTFDYEIQQLELTSKNTEIKSTNPSFGTGTESNVTVKVDLDNNGTFDRTLVRGTDYYLQSNTGESLGNYTFTVVGQGNYKGKVNGSYQIVQADISGIKVSIPDQAYTGKPITPSVTLSLNNKVLVPNVDYTITYSNNIEVGTANVKIVGKGNYKGTINTTFKITPVKFDLSVTNGNTVYTGQPQKGGASVNVLNATGVTIKYGTTQGTYNLTSLPSYTDAGVYTVYYQVSKTGFTTVTGSLTITINQANNKIAFKNNQNVYSTVNPNSISASVITTFPGTITVEGGAKARYEVSGNNIKIIPLGEGSEDFTVRVAGNKNYTGSSIKGTLIIEKGKITVVAKPKTVTYNGQPQTLDFAVNSPSGTTTKFSWGDNKTSTTAPTFINAGKYTVSYSTSKVGYADVYGILELIINPKTIPADAVSGWSDTYDYTGNLIKPKITVLVDGKTLVENTDYVVEYTNNVLPGTATITVKGIGNYTGTVVKTFNIKALGMDIRTRNGEAQFTGYETIGEGDKKALVHVNSPSNYKIAYSKTRPACLNSNSCTDADYKELKMPRFKDVGVHTVYFHVSAPGYKDTDGTLTITITKRQVKTPTPFPEEGLLYTGLSQTPSWLNYSSKYMTMDGKLSATEPGTYDVKFTIKEPHNVEWEGGGSEARTVQWTIIKKSIKDHETVKQMGVNYDEWKQLNIDDAKTTFDRVGYTQIGWIGENVATKDPEGCTDVWNDVLQVYDRKCNYSTIYDTGSSVFGAYVAKQVGYKEEVPYDLYAVWSTVSYKISYDLCDGKGCGAFDTSVTSIVPYDTAFTVPNPIRPGYIFTGWDITEMDKTPHIVGLDSTSEPEYSTPEEWHYDTGADVSYKNLTSRQGWTVKFKARWEPIKFNLKFDPNVGSYKDDNSKTTTANLSGSTPSIEVSYDKPINLPSNGFNLKGYNYQGWMQNPDWRKPGLEYKNKQEILNLDFIDWKGMAKDHLSREEIETRLNDVRLYAKWLRNSDTNFTVSHWKQKIGSNCNTQGPACYDLVGVETYSGESDRNITVIPYSYKGTPSSTVSNDYIVNNSRNTGNTNKVSITPQATSSESPNRTTSPKVNFVRTTNTDLKDDYFRGFTAPSQVKVTILPNGDRNIDFYYTRNTYTITYYMNGGTTSNPTNRQYQVKVTFTNPLDGNLKNGSGDEGGTNNSGQANFEGWYENPNVTVKIYGVDGEVVTNEEVYAKWLQYRYSGHNKNEQSWTPWGKSNE